MLGFNELLKGDKSAVIFPYLERHHLLVLRIHVALLEGDDSAPFSDVDSFDVLYYEALHDVHFGQSFERVHNDTDKGVNVSCLQKVSLFALEQCERELEDELAAFNNEAVKKCKRALQGNEREEKHWCADKMNGFHVNTNALCMTNNVLDKFLA